MESAQISIITPLMHTPVTALYYSDIEADFLQCNLEDYSYYHHDTFYKMHYTIN